MNISILTVFKELYTPFMTTSLLKRAQDNGLVLCDIHSFFEYVQPKERIDAPPFGPGTGMLIKPEVVARAITAQEEKYGSAFKIFFSPQGKKLDQDLARFIAQKMQEKKHLMLVPARYEGMDARVESYYADLEVSIGDYVLMGGDIPAMVLLESVTRLLPGVVSKEESLHDDSFTGPFLDYPEYTEPVEWNGISVPDIVRSGHHQAIAQWRTDQAVKKTVLTHFDWIQSYPLLKAEKKIIQKHIPAHYVALMHEDVVVGPERLPGKTSVMSLDVHDIARSSKTYGVQGLFVVTSLKDQKAILDRFLSFWKEGDGVDYRQDRHQAIKAVTVLDSIDAVIAEIEMKHGQKPLVVATSAQMVEGHPKPITFHDQGSVWAYGRPVLILLGTGNGLSTALIDRADFVLVPLMGLTDFNHLSVRSAAAIILDRWLGINEKKLPQ